MKRLLFPIFMISLMFSTPAMAKDTCRCDEICQEACARGEAQDCACDCGCAQGEGCVHGLCE